MIVLKSEKNSVRGFRIDLDVPIKTMKLCGLSSQHNLYENRRNSYLCIVFISFFFFHHVLSMMLAEVSSLKYFKNDIMQRAQKKCVHSRTFLL